MKTMMKKLTVFILAGLFLTVPLCLGGTGE